MPSMKSKKTNRTLFLALSFGIIGFFTLITFFGDEGVLKLKKLREQRNQLKKENQALFEANQKLKEEVSLLQNPRNTEALIREKLGYVKEGEYLLILNGKVSAEDSPDAEKRGEKAPQD